MPGYAGKKGDLMKAVPPFDDYVKGWSMLHGGYEPGRSRMVDMYLRMVYAIAKPFAAISTSPDLVTLLGLLVGVSVPVISESQTPRMWIFAAVIVVASGVLDGVDGAVAVLSSKASRWGHVADSLVDRLVEVAMLIALHRSGAPAWITLLAGVMTASQEYARARAAGVGLTDITVVTVSERPTRIIATVMAFLAAAFMPHHSVFAVTVGAAIWAVLGTIGLMQMIVAVRRILMQQ